MFASRKVVVVVLFAVSAAIALSVITSACGEPVDTQPAAPTQEELRAVQPPLGKFDEFAAPRSNSGKPNESIDGVGMEGLKMRVAALGRTNSPVTASFAQRLAAVLEKHRVVTKRGEDRPLLGNGAPPLGLSEPELVLLLQLGEGVVRHLREASTADEGESEWLPAALCADLADAIVVHAPSVALKVAAASFMADNTLELVSEDQSAPAVTFSARSTVAAAEVALQALGGPGTEDDRTASALQLMKLLPHYFQLKVGQLEDPTPEKVVAVIEALQGKLAALGEGADVSPTTKSVIEWPQRLRKDKDDLAAKAQVKWQLARLVQALLIAANRNDRKAAEATLTPKSSEHLASLASLKDDLAGAPGTREIRFEAISRVTMDQVTVRVIVVDRKGDAQAKIIGFGYHKMGDHVRLGTD